MNTKQLIESLSCHEKEKITKEYMKQYPYICKDIFFKNIEGMTKKDKKQYIESIEMDLMILKDE